jgi:dCMP deaminase
VAGPEPLTRHKWRRIIPKEIKKYKGMIAMLRRDKQNYYLDIAETVLERGTCLRRNFGAIIVKNDQIISTGYTGAPRGRENCCDSGFCTREKLGIPRGERYELCRSVHAEANAIIAASRNDMIESTLYLVGKDTNTNQLIEIANSCSMCKRLIINAGISTVVIRNSHDTFTIVDVAEQWVNNDDSLEGQRGY